MHIIVTQGNEHITIFTYRYVDSVVDIDQNLGVFSIHPDKIQVKQNAIGKLSELKPTGFMCLYNNYQL
ncbi:hypothetical protein HanHA300_Chr10g0373971 [Helianthus annuus]|nr:hypothetical protein HanHA300_Chr10g0373971 [Helianthus annuus]